jgi:hypothetical protein
MLLCSSSTPPPRTAPAAGSSRRRRAPRAPPPLRRPRPRPRLPPAPRRCRRCRRPGTGTPGASTRFSTWRRSSAFMAPTRSASSREITKRSASSPFLRRCVVPEQSTVGPSSSCTGRRAQGRSRRPPPRVHGYPAPAPAAAGARGRLPANSDGARRSSPP